MKPRALFSFSLGRGRLFFFPLIALKTFFLSLLFVTAVFLALEYLIIPGLEDHGQIAGYSWWREDERINLSLAIRNHAQSDHPLFDSPAIVFTPEKKQARRILVLGDSFVWGDGYANFNDLWWRQLHRELAARGYDVEIVASGYGGASTHLELDTARELVPRFRPDAVIYGYVTNDPDERQVSQFEASPDPVFERVNKLLDHGFGNLWYTLFRLHEKRVTKQQSGPERGFGYDDWELEILKGENFERYKTTVAALGEHCRQIAIPCMVVTLPNIPSAERFDPRYGPVRPLFEAAHVPFYDLLPDFIAAYGAEKESVLAWGINPANSHPGRRSTHFYAAKTADILERDYRGVLGEKGAARPPKLSINDWMPADLELARETPAKVRFKPAISKLTLRMPARRPYLQFNLEEAINVHEIRIDGGTGARAEVAITTVDPRLGYDTGERTELGTRAGEERRFSTPPSVKINTVRISGDVLSAAAPVTLELIAGAERAP